MGKLRNKRIIQSRIFLDPTITDIPSYDYDYSYPITVYEAVKRDMDDDSTSLDEELKSIYRLIAGKQDIFSGGISGQLMTFSGIPGQVGALNVVKSINSNPLDRSNSNIPTEVAVGLALDSKVSLKAFNSHTDDNAIHINDVERARWNSMAPLSTLNSHIANTIVHITSAERAAWNSNASKNDLDKHIYDTNNPHGVTAHHVGTYSQKEIDDMFAQLRESFFNYKNILWDERNNQAGLVEYNASYWNPNYILEYGEEPPDVDNNDLIYFALRPLTDYETNETDDCVILIHAPGLNWREVGLASMRAGDLVIQYPDTTMYVWIEGKFRPLFTNSSSIDDSSNPGISTLMWRPSLNDDGELIWIRSTETTPPDPMIVKGADGYTPVKGVDYDDGKDGVGVPIGGDTGSILTKVTTDNFDTTWRTLDDIINDMVVAGKSFPEGAVVWNKIVGRPTIYYEPGEHDDGIMSQKAITMLYDTLNNTINQLAASIQGPNGLEPLKESLDDHIHDYSNPHRTTAADVGAVPIAQFTDHINNFNNPHHVTAKQIGLGNVDNTSDVNKPISNAVQLALDEITKKITAIVNNVDSINYMNSVEWVGKTYTMTFSFSNGTKKEISLPINDIFNSIYFDEKEMDLVIVLPDNSEHRINIAALIQTYSGSIGSNIQVTVENDNIIRASIIPGSIGELEIRTSVPLRGSPTTTTQPVSDKSTRIATTEFVRNQVIDSLISYEPDRPLSANQGRILNQRKVDVEDIIDILNDIEGIEVIDNLQSTNTVAALSANMGRYLDLEKAPRIHTSTSGSTFGRSTITLFGHAKASDVDPLMDGTVSRGTDDGTYARGNHRHPTDVSRAPIHWPDVEHKQYELTGEPKSVSPPDDSNDTRIATTEWVRKSAVGVMRGQCTTTATTATKVVTLESDFMDDPVFMRQKGSSVSVYFKYANTAASPKMNVHGSGAAPIFYGGKYIVNDMIKAGYTYFFTFDGTNWNLINPTGIHTLTDGDHSNSLVSSEWVHRNAVGTSHGECTTGETVAAKEATLKSTYMENVVFIRQIGSSVAIKFTKSDKSGATQTTLNVNGTGASPVKYAGRDLENGMIGAGYTHLFEFDGTNWNLMNPVPGTGYGELVFGPNSSSGSAGTNGSSGGMSFGTSGSAEAGSNTISINNPVRSGMWGYTIDTANNTTDSRGYVNQYIVTITYPYQASDIKFSISNTAGHWAVKMGDATNIALTNPTVLAVNRDNAVVKFTMSTNYPSNSPGMLLYTNAAAKYTIAPKY